MLSVQLARAYFLNGQHRRAVHAADRVLETAEHANLVDVVADTLVTRGSALGSLGQYTEGLAVLQAGQELAAAHGSSTPSCARWATGPAGSRPGSSARPSSLGRAGLAVARRLGPRSQMVLLGGNAVAAP